MIEFVLGITLLIIIAVVWKGISCMKNNNDTSED